MGMDVDDVVCAIIEIAIGIILISTIFYQFAEAL